MKSSLQIGQIPLAFLLLITLSACGIFQPALNGMAYPNPAPAPDINLVDQNGQAFQLRSFGQKVGLVFFGFSHCTSECPRTLALLRSALQIDGASPQDVLVAMVSTDPENDTPDSLKEFMGRFDPHFLGLLGSPQELAKTWKSYGVVVEDGGETHSSFTYAVDKHGNLREALSPDLTPEEIAADLKILLEEK